MLDGVKHFVGKHPIAATAGGIVVFVIAYSVLEFR